MTVQDYFKVTAVRGCRWVCLFREHRLLDAFPYVDRLRMLDSYGSLEIVSVRIEGANVDVEVM